ncbi:hypothetical protein [Streptomyces carpaticus]|uniref:hypothetical protein n=1 Tax=Streptomyces carpaticus TaxID=285558 RepID=UPI0031F7ED29
MTSFDAVWEELGVRHGGVLFVEEMVRAGVPAGTVRGVLRRHRWQRVGVGAYAEPGCEVSYWMRLYAVQRRRPDVVASHRSAAALLGFDVLRHALEVTRAGGGGALTGMRVHRAPLAAGDIVEVDRGVRVTGPARTVADVLRAPLGDEGVVVADCALRRRAVTPGQVREALQGLRGRRRGLAALGRARGASGSPAETVARLRMAEAGLEPECQVPLGGIRVDFFFAGRGLVVEVEGHRWHGGAPAHQRDTVRFNRLMSLPGVRGILRFTAQDVFRRPRWMVRTIRGALVREPDDRPGPPLPRG